MARTKGSKNKPKTEVKNTGTAPTTKSVKKTPEQKRPIEKTNDLNRRNSNITKWGNTYPNITAEDIAEKQLKVLLTKNTRGNLENILFKRAKWTLPDTCLDEVIEKGFYDQDGVVIYKDPDGNVWAYGAIRYGKPNSYGKPLLVKAKGWNGFQELVEVKYPFNAPENPIMKDLIKQMYKGNNIGVYEKETWSEEFTYKNVIDEFTEILVDNLLQLRVATNRLKDPFILGVDSLAAKKNGEIILDAINNNKAKSIVVKDTSIATGEKISLKDLFELVEFKGNPENVKTILQIYNANFNRFLQTIGINTNPDPDKAEYVNDEQTNSNNSVIDIEQDVWFTTRKRLADNANKILGTNISVEKNIDEMNKLITENKAPIKEEEDNGNEEK